MIRPLLSGILVLFTAGLQAQTPDTLKLKEVSINAYFNPRPLFSTTSAVAVIDSLKMANQQGTSLVPVMNTIPGVRMEERSPGSYRLSIRGSLLRSPFGIRNVKMYINELPLTDGGGNTYLNLIDPDALESIEILKGPDGSQFGANSGGVVRLSPYLADSTGGMFRAKAGSYGLMNQEIALNLVNSLNRLRIYGSNLQSDGYRENSALSKKYIQLSDLWQYSERASFTAFGFYSDLNYQTPGGLNFAQFEANPSAARQPTAVLPSASDQKAGIHNQTIYGGIQHNWKLDDHFSHVFALMGSGTHFENPFITNFEVRKEKTVGVRSWLNYRTSFSSSSLTVTGGFESISTTSKIDNYGNRGGVKDTIQASDQLLNGTQTLFLSSGFWWRQRLLLEASTSLNFGMFSVQRNEPILTEQQKKTFGPETMPKLGASYLLTSNLTIRASVSKGFSTPTLAEIRSSDNTINTSLEAERGWNYEAGIRLRDQKRIVNWDISVFQFRLDRAIVRRVNAAGQEYFANAGGTIQPGLESNLTLQLLQKSSGIIRGLRFNNAFTLSDFRFKSYTSGNADYSGNLLTGVPRQVVVTGFTTMLPANFSLYLQHSYNGSIPLNDQNSVFASSYRLVQAKLSWTHYFESELNLQASLGVDNLMNEKYSLGNDLNAVGNRFYNAAPLRNYWLSMALFF